MSVAAKRFQARAFDADRLRCPVTDDFAGKRCCEPVDILPVEVQPERVPAGLEPAFNGYGEMNETADAVRHHPVFVWASGVEREAQSLEKGLCR